MFKYYEFFLGSDTAVAQTVNEIKCDDEMPSLTINQVNIQVIFKNISFLMSNRSIWERDPSLDNFGIK